MDFSSQDPIPITVETTADQQSDAWVDDNDIMIAFPLPDARDLGDTPFTGIRRLAFKGTTWCSMHQAIDYPGGMRFCSDKPVEGGSDTLL